MRWPLLPSLPCRALTIQSNSAYPGIFTFAAGVFAGAVYPALQILPNVGAVIIVTPTTALAVAIVIGLLWCVEGGSPK